MLEENPLVTIITLTYNNIECLCETIDSVLRQTYDSIEYIISDDGTFDFPLETIKDYIQKNRSSNLHCRFIIHEINVGTVRNANLAYEEANGKYILPLSCGDTFYSNITVEKIVERFKKTGCRIICASRCLVNEKGAPVRYMPCKLNQNKIHKLNTAEKQHKAFILREFYEMASGSATYMERKFWIDQGKFDEHYLLWEDGPFYEKITDKNEYIEFAYDLITINYRAGGVSTGSKPNSKLYQDLLLFNAELLKRIDLLKLKKFEYRKLSYFINKCEHNKKICIEYPDVIIWKAVMYMRNRCVILIDKILCHFK